MDQVRTWLEMGGYAWFVWPAYALTVGVMAWLVVDSLRGLRADRRTLDALQGDEHGRQGRRNDS